MYLQKARKSLCYDPTSGKWLTYLEIFPEDLLCHASALSSLALTLKFKYLILHLATITLLVYRTFFIL